MAAQPVPGNVDVADRNQWYLVSSHGAVLFYIATNPDCTIREVSRAMTLTQRTVWGVIGDLRQAGMLHVRKEGRRRHYTVNLDAPFLHPTLNDYTLRPILGRIADQSSRPLACSWASRPRRTTPQGRDMGGQRPSPGRANLPFSSPVPLPPACGMARKRGRCRSTQMMLARWDRQSDHVEAIQVNVACSVIPRQRGVTGRPDPNPVEFDLCQSAGLEVRESAGGAKRLHSDTDELRSNGPLSLSPALKFQGEDENAPAAVIDRATSTAPRG